ncbi:hypothetical protein GF407_18990 [candidate division KSB1 bacterium]|nr:hypothetical protein [candidate division KSB1 bacterium]
MNQADHEELQRKPVPLRIIPFILIKDIVAKERVTAGFALYPVSSSHA